MNLLHYFLFGSIFNVYFIIVIVTNLLGLAATIVQVPDCFVSCLLRGNSCEAETPRLGVLRHPCLIKMTPKGGTDESSHRTKEMEDQNSTRRFNLVVYHLLSLSLSWFSLLVLFYLLFSSNHFIALSWLGLVHLPSSPCPPPYQTPLIHATVCALSI